MQNYSKNLTYANVCEKKSAEAPFFSRAYPLRIALVVGLATHFPQVGLHGLFAVGLVLLCAEGLLVGSDFRQVFRTRSDGGRNGSETLTLSQFVCRGLRGAGDGTQSAQVDTATVGVSRLGYAVGSQYHFLVGRVRRLLVDAGECTADGFDCIGILYFCHGTFGVFAEQTVLRTERPLR